MVLNGNISDDFIAYVQHLRDLPGLPGSRAIGNACRGLQMARKIFPDWCGLCTIREYHREWQQRKFKMDRTGPHKSPLVEVLKTASRKGQYFNLLWRKPLRCNCISAILENVEKAEKQRKQQLDVSLLASQPAMPYWVMLSCAVPNDRLIDAVAQHTYRCQWRNWSLSQATKPALREAHTALSCTGDPDTGVRCNRL